MPIKIIGLAAPDLGEKIADILQSSTKDEVTQISGKSKTSKSGQYQSFTFEITVTSHDHLDEVYQKLMACEGIKWLM